MKFLQNKIFQKTQKPLQAQNRFALTNQTPARLIGNLLILLIITCVFVITVVLRDSIISNQIEEMKQQLFNYSSQHGFGINDIIVEGRKKTTITSLNEKINLNRNDSILQIDLNELKTKIEDLPWIERAELKRSYFPNILQISLKEKQIIALYQSNGKYYPIDKYGNIIQTDYIPNVPVMIIVGEHAPEKLFELFNVILTDPELFSHIKAATLNSERRWDLTFNDLDKGIKVKLPEENIKQAWEKLRKINNKYGIFKRKLTSIDLRYEDRVNVEIAQ